MTGIFWLLAGFGVMAFLGSVGIGLSEYLSHACH